MADTRPFDPALFRRRGDRCRNGEGELGHDGLGSDFTRDREMLWGRRRGDGTIVAA
jgi:hypothetical protein